MLGARVATALVLLAILLPTIFVFPAASWGVVTLALLAVAAWEWTRLLPGARHAVLSGAALALVGLAALAWRTAHPWPGAATIAACALLAAFWIAAGPLRLRGDGARRGGWPLAAVLLLGCWLSLLELRMLGAVPLLSSMAVIWVADIGAYFAGRAFGRHKLAPSISPGKTWEGVAGGVAAVLALGLGATAVPALRDALPSVIASVAGPWAVAPVLVAIVALSIVGDLHESLLKRLAGVKDSSRLLPGHGGVLDRIDSLIPTMPLAVAVYEIFR